MAGGEGAKRSDLGTRALSAFVMVAVAAMTFWFGGWLWIGFVVLVSIGVLWEWMGLVGGFKQTPMGRGLWNGTGLIYVAFAGVVLIVWRQDVAKAGELLALMAAVIATDIFAYFFGRTFGGPKIAPRISPSKTWAGLFGGIIGAALMMLAAAYNQYYAQFTPLIEKMQPGDFIEAAPASVAVEWLPVVLVGAGVAIVAQAGDFFESWMKRRAGVKDSGNMLPGHGGLLDRVDGLLAVLFVSGALFVAERVLYPL